MPIRNESIDVASVEQGRGDLLEGFRDIRTFIKRRRYSSKQQPRLLAL
jgi:hypothetical protein